MRFVARLVRVEREHHELHARHAEHPSLFPFAREDTAECSFPLAQEENKQK